MTLKMKKLIPLITAFIFSVSVYAGDPPPVGGDPTGDPGATPIGGSAPVGSGLILVIGMGLAYGTKKVFQNVKKSDLK